VAWESILVISILLTFHPYSKKPQNVPYLFFTYSTPSLVQGLVD